MNVCLFGDARSPHIRRLSQGLAGRDVAVHVVCHKPVAIPGVTVERFAVPPASFSNAHRWRRRVSRYLAGFLRDFDVVHVHFLHDWGFEAEHMGLGCFVATPWGSEIVHPPLERPPSSELIAKRIQMLHQAPCVTVVGPTFARMVEAFAGLPAGRVQVVPWGVDLDHFMPDRANGDHNRRGACVGFFKGFREVYGPRTLVEAVPDVLAHYEDTVFEFVGAGAMLDACRDLADRLGVQGSIRWSPPRPMARLPELLSTWDLTVMPSVCEAFGMAALEAAAMELPVVASDVGGFRDSVVDGATGLLIPVGAPFALAQAIIRLLESDEMRKRMGRAGRRFVAEHYEQQACLTRQIEAYRMAMDARAVMV